METSDMNGVLSAKIPEKVSANNSYVNLRIINSSKSESTKVLYTTWRPFISPAFVSFSTDKTVAVNPYESISIPAIISGEIPITLTFTDSSKYDINSASAAITFSPDKTKTYTIAKVSNICGIGQGKGSTTVQVNPIGIKVVSVAPELLCQGDKIYVKYSKSDESNQIYKLKIRLSPSNDNSISYDFDAVDNSGTLTGIVPLEVPKGSYRLKVISSEIELSSSQGALIQVAMAPNVWWYSKNQSIPFGASVDLNFGYTGIGPTYITFSDGSTSFSRRNGFFEYAFQDGQTIKPENNTLFWITSLSSGCNTSTFTKEKIEITVKDGIRTDSVLTNEVCTGQKVRVRFTSNAKFNPSNTFNVKLDESFPELTNIPAILVEPGVLEFVIPLNSYGKNGPWVPGGVSVTVNSTSPRLIGSKSPNTISVRDLPFIEFKYPSYHIDKPKTIVLDVDAYGGGPYKLRMKDGLEFTLIKGWVYGNFSRSFSLKGTNSKVFELSSVSNSCGTTSLNSSLSLIVDNPGKDLLELGELDRDGIFCEDEKKVISFKSGSNFQSDNEFRVELVNNSNDGQVIKTLGVSKSDGRIEVQMPKLLTEGYYYLRVSSTNPIAYSNSREVHIQKKPELAKATSSTTAIFLEDRVTIFTPNVIGGSPIKIEFNDGSSIINDGISDDAHIYQKELSFTKVPTTYPLLYYVKSVSNSCGTTFIDTPKKIDTIFVDAYRIYALGDDGFPYSISACKGGKVAIPYYIRGNPPKDAKIYLEISPTFDGIFKTIASDITTNPYIFEIPDTLSNSLYSLRLRINNNQPKLSDGRIFMTLTEKPSTELFFADDTKTQTITSINSGPSITIKVKSKKGEPAKVILGDEAGNVYPLNANIYNNYTNIPIKKSTTFTLKSVSNNCGYEVGNTQKLTLTVNPDFSASLAENKSSVCAGGTFDINIATIGDFGKDNKFSFYFFKTSDITNPKTLLASEYLGDNKYRITVPSDTPVNPYAIFVNSSGTGIQKDYQNLIYVHKAPNIVLSGTATMNPGQSGNVSLQLYNSSMRMFGVSNGYSNYDYEISNGIKGSANYGNSVTSINIPAPLATTTYKLLSVRNACGTGDISGSATINVIPPSLKNIQIPDNAFYYIWTCTGASLSVPFKTLGTFSPENKFTVQLSDEMGLNFKSLPTEGKVSPLKVIIPDSIKAGVGYKVRVVASDDNVSSSTNLDLLQIFKGPTAAVDREVYSFEQGKPVSIKLNFTGTPAWSITFGSDEFSARSYYVNSNPFVLDLNPVSSTTYKIFSVSDLYCKGVIPSAKSTTRLELITATEEFNEMGAKVFPNPTAEFINLALEKSQPALVRLTDSMGKLVLETSVSGYENKLDVSKLSSGTYLLLVEQGLNRSVFKIRKD